MLICEDDGRSPAACRPAERDGFRIPSSGRAGTRLDYQDSVRAAPPWSGATDADSHLDPAPAGSNRAEFAAVRARIIAAADDARRRIARDLHDGLQQQLACLGLRVRLAGASVPSGHEELKGELAGIADGLREALENVREISRGLHPAILSQCGLGPAVKALAGRSPVPVRLRAQITGRLPDPVEIGAYYIIGEALANAAKHANAASWTSPYSSAGRSSPWPCMTTASEAPTRTAPGWPGSPTASTPSPEPCNCSARQAAEPISPSTSQPEQPRGEPRAVEAARKNKDPPDTS